MATYQVAHLDELDELIDGTHPFRPGPPDFGISSFGVTTGPPAPQATASSTSTTSRTSARMSSSSTIPTSTRSGRRSSAGQRQSRRVGGQYLARTGPISELRGTVPQTRESHEPVRLSPRKK